MKPLTRLRFPRLGGVVLVFVISAVLQEYQHQCHGQVLEIDVGQRLGGLYERINRGAYNMLHWPHVRRKEVSATNSQTPQVVLFSKNHSASKVVRSRGISSTTQDLDTSASEFRPQYSENNRDLVTYVNNVLRKTVVDADTASGGSDFYSLKSWDGSGRGYRQSSENGGDFSDISTSTSGAGHFVSSNWVNGPPRGQQHGRFRGRPLPPPRPRPGPRPHYSFGPPTKHHDGPPKSYYRLPPIKSYRPPVGPPPLPSYHVSHIDHDNHAHDWDFDGPPVSLAHSGWGWSPPIISHSGWGWSPPAPKEHGDGWGWGPKCDPNAPPFELNSYDDIPQGATFVDGHNRTSTRDDLPPTLVPAPPVVFTVGVRTTLPPNYSTQFSEQLDIRLNPDGTTNLHRDVNHRPDAAAVRPGSNAGTSSTTSGFGGVRNRNQHQQLNSLRMTSSVIASPYISAPINGSTNNNGFFSRALQERANMFRDGPQHPFVSQLDVLLQLFNQLDDLQRQQNEIDAKNEKNGGWGWNGDSRGGGDQQGDFGGIGVGNGRNGGNNGIIGPGIGGGGTSDLAAPTVVLMVQRFSVPEPNTSEAGMLDSAFNFGPQANRFTFGDLDLVTDGWKDVGGQSPIPFDLSNLGNSVEEAQTALNLRVRGYVKALREASAAAYEPVEEMSYGGFEQHQYFIIPADTCQQPIDPPKFRGTTSNNCAFGPINPNQNAPSCFPPRC